MSRRAAVGVPIGVAATIFLAAVAGSFIRSDGAGPAPLPLPLSLARGGGEAATADSRMAAPYGGTSYRFVGRVPADLPDRADAHRLAAGAPAKSDVRRLADALGLTGVPITTESDALVVRRGEWVLRAATTAGRMWSYYREVERGVEGCSAPDPGPDATDQQRKEAAASCAGPGAGVKDSGGGTSGSGGSDGTAGVCVVGADSPCNGTTDSDEPVMSCPEPAPCPPDTKCATVACASYEEPVQQPLGPESEATAVARRIFGASGLAVGKLRAERGFDAWHISATAFVDGLEVIGLGLFVSVDGDGTVRDASGSLALAKAIDSYPLISATAGLKRLQAQAGGDLAIAVACPPPGAEGAPEQPECGGRTEPVVLDVTGVRLGLLFSPVWTERGEETVYLAPAWVYDVMGRDYPEAVIAVADEYLQQVSPEQPRDEPQPDPAATDRPTQVEPTAPVDPPSGRPTAEPPPAEGPRPQPSEPPRPDPSEAPRPGTTDPNPSGSAEPGPAETISAEPQPTAS